MLLLEHRVAIKNVFFSYGHILLCWPNQPYLVVIWSHPEEETSGAAHKASEVLVFSCNHCAEHTGEWSLHVNFRNLFVAQLVEVFHQVGRPLEEAAPS
jgi:hypothetical protein